jgi:general secretion pathway protein H
MNQPRSGEGQAGFTLIEMIVLLVVIGLVLSLFIERGPMRSPALEARAAADQVAQGLRLARSRAIFANRPVAFILNVATHSYSVDGAPPRVLPPSLAVSMTTVAGATIGKTVGAIGFEPDGSSSGGRIELVGGGRKLQIGVDWLTGRVSMAAAP